MSIGVQELRPESLKEAITFARGCGCAMDDGRVIPALSLVAVDEGTLVAAALCVEQPDGRHRIEVGIPDLARHAALNRTLIDKGLMKLASAGVRKFDIRSNGSDEQRDFWQAVSWIDQTLNNDEDATPRVDLAAASEHEVG